MLKLSEILTEAAKKTARKLLEENLPESEILEMPSYRISRTDICPTGYVKLGKIKEKNVDFYIYQMF